MPQPLGDKGSTLNPFLFVQQNTERELRAQLHAAAQDIGSALQRLEGTDGIGAVARRAQYRIVQAEIAATQAALWDGVGSTISIGKARAIDAAADSIASLTSIYLAAPGVPVPADLAEALVFQARQGMTNVMSRSTNGISLSDRVYDQRALSTGKVAQIIDSGIIGGMSAREIAKQAYQFISPMTPGGASYAAMRLGRTELNNAFHTTAVKQWGVNPFVEKVVWNLSGSHVVPDECNALDGQQFDPAKVPGKPHPQCFCYITALMTDEDKMVEKYANGEYDAYLDDKIAASASKFPETDRERAMALTQRRVYTGPPGPMGGLPRAKTILELPVAQRSAYLTGGERALIKRVMTTPAGSTKAVAKKAIAKAPARAKAVVAPKQTVFQAEHAAAKARLPVDRSMIGKVKGKDLTSAEAKAERIAQNNAKVGGPEAIAKLPQLEVELAKLEALADEAKAVGEAVWKLRLVPTDEWPAAIKAALKDAKVSLNGEHRDIYDRVFNWQQAVKQNWQLARGEVGELRGAVRSAKDIMAQTSDWSLKGVVRADIDPLTGKLGADSQKALDAIIDAGKAMDKEINARMLIKYGERPADIPYGSGNPVTYEMRNARAIAQRAWDKRAGKMLTDVLGEVRPLGGKGPQFILREYDDALGAPILKSDPNKLMKRMEAAQARYPAEWNAANAAANPRVNVFQVNRGYNRAGKDIALSGKSQHVATHELGHSMELVVDGLRGSEWAMIHSRSIVEDAATGKWKLPLMEQTSTNASAAGELGLRDAWSSRYSGRVYGDRAVGADAQWEVFTTGVESLMDGSEYFGGLPGQRSLDTQFKHYILGVLSVL
jgi:hypothetical protein